MNESSEEDTFNWLFKNRHMHHKDGKSPIHALKIWCEQIHFKI